MAGLGDDFANDRRYQQPWSRSRNLVFLVGMPVFAALLAWAGLLIVNATAVWQ